MQTMDNIDTDNVATADTENTSADSQSIEQPQAEPEAVEQTEEEKAEQAKQEQETEKQSRSQKRIQQLAREKAELQRKVAEYEQKQSEPKATDAPNIEDFDDYSEYQKAQQEYYVAQAEQRVLLWRSAVSRTRDHCDEWPQHQPLHRDGLLRVREGRPRDRWRRGLLDRPAL